MSNEVSIEIGGHVLSFRVREDGVIGIGAAGECTIRFDESEAVARSHAELRNECGRWYLVDRRTRRGCRLNGKEVEVEPVEEGDVVTLPAHPGPGVEPLSFTIVSLPTAVRMDVSDIGTFMLVYLDIHLGAKADVMLTLWGRSPELAPPIAPRTATLLAALVGEDPTGPWPSLSLADEYRLHGSQSDNVRGRHRSALRTWWAEVLVAFPALAARPEYARLVPEIVTEPLRLEIPRSAASVNGRRPDAQSRRDRPR
jgi:hypothetical protein